MLNTLLLSTIVSCGAGGPPVDLVIENARIWSDGRVGFAEFAAVDDGRFVYVGERDEIYIGNQTTRIDADGRVVIPGIIDSHVHMLGGGEGLSELQLRDATSKADFIALVEQWTDDLRPGRWVLGGRWSVESWDQPESPTKEWVDPVTGDRPLYLPRMDGHSALVNSAALELAGITIDGPPDPEGGVIDRDPETGEPTGILRESAMGLVSRHIPPSSTEDKVEALRAAIDHALAHGITTVADIPGLGDLRAYEQLAVSDDLKMRFFLYPTTGRWDLAVRVVEEFKGRPGWVEINGFKGYLDGSLGSRTAYMRAPYLGNEPHQPEWRGLFREGVEGGGFQRNIDAAERAGLQSIAHAIGDEANHHLLNTLESTYGDHLREARCRSEHAQHLLPGDVQRFGDLGVIASMQPYHKTDDGRYAESYIGSERAKSSYAFKDLLDAGAVLAFGSDWPVVTLHPFLGVEAAVTGRVLTGDYWQTQNNISVPEALKAYTSSGAYSVFAEDEIGRIEPYFRADFVILNRSPFDAEPDWAAIRPVAVYIDGRRVYEADGGAGSP